MYYNTDDNNILYYGRDAEQLLLLAENHYARQRDGPTFNIRQSYTIIITAANYRIARLNRHANVMILLCRYYFYTYWYTVYLHNMPTSMTWSKNASNLCAVRVSLLVYSSASADRAPRVGSGRVCVSV